MTRPRLRALPAVALAVALLLVGVSGAPAASAASPRQTGPSGVNTASPTVSGKLVAKATGKASPMSVSCAAGAAPILMTVRGAVICTESGRLVLLQIAGSTRIFDRDWHRIGYGRLVIGDHLNAWGTWRDDGTVLNPTVAIQDISRSTVKYQTVVGRLVAMPGAAPNGQVVCGDHDRTGDAQTALNRGLVICTEEGKLILLQLSSATRTLTRDGVNASIEDFTLGDSLSGTGTLQADGFVMNPTVRVVDNNLQTKGTNSQDFIADGGARLTLYVLKSDPGPVEGRVFALPDEPTHVTLCGGKSGSWSDLKQGLTVDISGSVFNVRTLTYVDSKYVRIVSCE